MSGFEIVQPSDLGAVLLILIMVLFGLASLLVGSLFRGGTGRRERPGRCRAGGASGGGR